MKSEELKKSEESRTDSDSSLFILHFSPKILLFHINLDLQFVKLFDVDGRRSIEHDVAA